MLNFKTDNQNREILRKLGYSEIYYNNSCVNGNLQVLYSFLITSKHDLYLNRDRINHAINHWQQQHPFLQCGISYKDEYDDLNKKINFNRYFVKLDNEALENVEFLYLKQQVETEDKKQSFTKLNELFLNSPIPFQSEILWRLVFVKLSNEHYCVFFQHYHEICGGVGGTRLMKQLLTIIDNNLEGKEVECINKLPVPKALENLLYDDNEAIIDSVKIPQEDYEIFSKSFILTENILENITLNFEMNGQLFNFIDNSLSVYSLKTYKLFEKADYFKLNKIQTQEFLKKCKMNNAKPNGAFASIIALALCKTFKTYYVKYNDINYGSIINLNQFLTQFVDINSMGQYPSRVVFNINADLIESAFDSDNSIKLNSLWLIAKNETSKLRKIIDEKRMFEYPKLRKNDIQKVLQIPQSEPQKCLSFNSYFFISNFGALVSIPEYIGNLKIIDHRLHTSTFSEEIPILFPLYVSMVNDCICFSFQLNTKFKIDFFECYIKNVQDIFFKIFE